MNRLLACRRTYIATLAILALTGLGFQKGIDTSSAIAMVAVGLAGANAYEGSKRS